MRRYVAVKPTNKAGVPSWRSQWSEASHPRGNRAVPHVPDSVPDFARPRDESVTAAGRLADLLTSCAAARPKGGAGCVSAHVRICPGPPGKPGGYRDGLPVAVVEDEHQFILAYRILWNESDTDVAVPIIDAVQAAFPEFNTCSFDRGFHSLKNREALDARLAVNALPKNGKLTLADRARESAPAFKAARQQHPAVESCLANFGLRGGALVREKSPENFALMVNLSVLAVNVHRLGCLVHDQERARIRRRRRRATTSQTGPNHRPRTGRKGYACPPNRNTTPF